MACDRSAFEDAGVFSRLTYGWIGPLIATANQRRDAELTSEDSAHLIPCAYLPSQLEARFLREHAEQLRQHAQAAQRKGAGGHGGDQGRHATAGATRQLLESDYSKPHDATCALAWALVRCHRPLLIAHAVLVLLVLGMR